MSKQKRILVSVHRRFRFILVGTVLRSIMFISPRLTLTYNNENPKDGCGAQLQRILSIYSLSRFLKVRYLHSEILDISTHALDPFQDETSRKAFVLELNRVFALDDDICVDPVSRNVPILNIRLLVKYSIESFLLNRQILLRVIEPFPLVDYCPETLNMLPLIDFDSPKDNASAKQLVVLHYRYGAGGFAMYHNQSTPRQLEYGYYLDCLGSISKQDLEDSRILLFTDAPTVPTKFEPPKEQLKFWAGTPNFDGQYIHIRQSEVAEFFAQSEYVVECVHGGSPLDAIRTMASADVLIMGKSSLSYVAALLNKHGTIYFPQDFWHSPLKNWICMP